MSKKQFSFTLLLVILYLSVSGCTTINKNTPVYLNFDSKNAMPLQKIKIRSLEQYTLAYCWTPTIDTLGDPQFDVVIKRGEREKVISSPASSPSSTPINLGCHGSKSWYRTYSGGLKWRPLSSELTMLAGYTTRASYFYFVEVDNNLTVMNTRKVWQHRDYFVEPNRIDWSPDGTWLAVDAYDAKTYFGSDIWLYNPSINKIKQLTSLHGLSFHLGSFGWSPSGEYLAYTHAYNESGISLIHLSDLQTFEITSTNSILQEWPFQLGSMIKVSKNGISLDQNTALHEVFQSYVIQQSPPVWFNDQFIFVAPSSKNRVSLFMGNMNGTKVTDLLPTSSGIALMPKISPNKDKLAFVHYSSWNRHNYAEISILDFSTMTVIPLVTLSTPDNDDGLYISGMDWTPDGKYLAFSSNHSGESDIYVISSDGKAWVNLTRNRDGDALSPVWKP